MYQYLQKQSGLLVLAMLTMLFGVSQADTLVSAETIQLANSRMDKADQALQLNDLATAHRFLESAGRAATENHGRGLAVITPRALGEQTYGRYFDLRQRIFTAMGKKAEANGIVWQQTSGPNDGPNRWRSRSAIGWYISAMNADEVERMLRNAPAEYDYFMAFYGGSVDGEGRFTFTMGDIERHTAPLSNYAPIARELELQSRFRNELIPLYKKKIRQNAEAILNSEANHFASPLSDLEKQYSEENWASVQEAVTGVKAEKPTPPEVTRKLRRTDDSKEMLRSAITWLDLLNDRSELAPAISVAAERGQTFMTIGNDTSLLPTVRQNGYEEAGDYFYIAKDTPRRERASELYMSMGDEVDAYLDERNAMKDAALEKMQAEAEAFQEAAEDMQKTEKEKKAFADEADSLEAELDFDP